MYRRRVVASLASGLVWASGCLGGGSDVVRSVQRDVSVTPGQGWVERIPDLSGSGGAVQYKARASQPFEVYFFASEESFMFYDTYTDGGDPARTPSGHGKIGTTAERVSDTTYEAETPNGGARQSIGEAGPYFFVVDHSDYGEAAPADPDNPSPLSVFLDLTVTKRQLF